MLVLPVGMLDKDINVQYLTTNAFYNSIKSNIVKITETLNEEKERYELSKLNPDIYPISSRRIYVSIVDLTAQLTRLEESEKNIRKKLETFSNYSVKMDKTA